MIDITKTSQETVMLYLNPMLFHWFLVSLPYDSSPFFKTELLQVPVG